MNGSKEILYLDVYVFGLDVDFFVRFELTLSAPLRFRCSFGFEGHSDPQLLLLLQHSVLFASC